MDNGVKRRKDGAHTSEFFFSGIHKTMSCLPSLGLLFLLQLVDFHCPLCVPMDSPSAQATPPEVGTMESLDSDCDMSSIDAGSYTSSNRDSDFVPWEEVQEIQLLHKATLQDLLKASNYPVWTLLQERNVLLRERYVSILSLLYPICSSPLCSKIPASWPRNRLPRIRPTRAT